MDYSLHLKSGGSFFDNYGVTGVKKTFRGFGDAKRLLDNKKYSDLLAKERDSGRCPLTEDKVFENEVDFPSRRKSCED